MNTRSYSEEQLEALRNEMKKRLSEKRFSHTLGVERTAAYLAENFLPEAESELRAAAILHDVAKELPREVQRNLLRKSGVRLYPSDMMCPAIFHSFAGAEVIRSDFPSFATPSILSAVRNHTVGTPDMPLFDEIVFLSDFMEDTRVYENSIALRRRFLNDLPLCKTPDERMILLHKACVEAMNSTLENLIANGKIIGEGLILSRNSLLSRIYQLG